MEKAGEVNRANHGEQAREVGGRPTVGARLVTPFGDYPRRHQQQSQALLELIAQQGPAGCGCAECPYAHDSRGPVLLHIEDLTDQGDSRPGRERADLMHGGCESGKAGPRKQAQPVEEGQHRKDQEQAGKGRDPVPMGRNKKQHAGAKQNGTENESDQHLPPAGAGLSMSVFIGADCRRARVIEQAGALPACQPDL